MSDSKRHHYIPQFHIKGFKGADDWYHVYDKKSGRINPICSSKGIFWEEHRNSIIEPGHTSPMIETQGYSVFETKEAPIIRALQSLTIDKDLLSNDNMMTLNNYIIGLYWRIPHSDSTFDTIATSDGFAISEDDDFFAKSKKSDRPLGVSSIKKIHRLLMTAQTMISYSMLNSHWEFRSTIYGISKPWFVLGDYPIIYPTEPISLLHVINQELYLPLSATRIYSNQPEKILAFDEQDVLTINAITIHQSVRYICAADKSFLEKSIKLYETLKQTNRLDSARRYLFESA
jgi:Protein of unknown function (DUF4238)